jgi:hypothetical protein
MKSAKKLNKDSFKIIESGLSADQLSHIELATVMGGACGGDACWGATCGGYACGGNACAGNACGGNACGGNACGLQLCPIDACGVDACIIDLFDNTPVPLPLDAYKKKDNPGYLVAENYAFLTAK